jgi:hypothetical protein
LKHQLRIGEEFLRLAVVLPEFAASLQDRGKFGTARNFLRGNRQALEGKMNGRRRGGGSIDGVLRTFPSEVVLNVAEEKLDAGVVKPLLLAAIG